MHVKYWLIMFLIFKKQAVIYEAVRRNFKCNGFVCVLSVFFGRQDFRIPCIILFIWQDAYFSVTVGGFPGGVSSKRFCWGLEDRVNLETCFPISDPNLWLSIPGQNEKRNFRRMRDLRLVRGSYKRPQLTRIDFHLHRSWKRLKICQFWCRKKN